MANFDLTGFVNQTVISGGLTAPIALAFLPDGRMLVVEKGGQIFIADPETGTKENYLNIAGIINSGNERGLLEIAISPDFDPTGQNGDNHIYLFYTRSAGTNAGVIGRFEHQENAGGLTSRAVASSEEILWTDTDGLSGCCHYGGGLDFGPDGKLWLTTSDKFNTTNPGEGFAGGDDVSVDLESTSGKIIRINRDGSIPDGTDGSPANPYVDGIIDGPYPGAGVIPDPSIWAYGLRNAFRADWDLVNGKLYIGEVGGNQDISRDDVHIASLDQPGVFYGWNFYEGVNSVSVSNQDRVYNPADFPQPDPDLGDPANGDYYSAPIYDIPHSSLTGGFVYRGSQFPDEFYGVYFFGNYEDGYIRFLDLNLDGSAIDPASPNRSGVYNFKPSGSIAGAASNIVFLEEGPDGSLYYINYSGTGGLVQRIVYGGNQAPRIIQSALTDDQGDPNDRAGADSPLTVSFSATVSDADHPLSALTYAINFGDGSPIAIGSPDVSTGQISVAHTYTGVNNYTASLSVSDGVSTTFATPFKITVGDPNDPPQILSVRPNVSFGDPGLTVTFTATVGDPDTTDPPETLTYIWDFGDGSPAVTGSPTSTGQIIVQHTYTTDGLFNASLTVSDGEAPEVSSGTIPIRVGAASALPVTNGLVFQVESFIKVGLNGSTVTEWLDQSGNGNNLVASGDPQYVLNATPTGQSAIVLDGNGDFLQRVAGAATPINGLSLGNAPRTMFFVVDYETVTNNKAAGLLYGKSGFNQAFGLTLDGNTSDFMVHGWGNSEDRPTDIDGVIDPFTGQQRGFVSHAVVFDGTAFFHYLNGTLIDTGAKTYATFLERLVIGQDSSGGETPMSVAAAFIYNRALELAEFNAVEDYVQTTYIQEANIGQPNAINDNYNITTGQLLTVPVSTGLLGNDTDDSSLSVIDVNGLPVPNNGAVISLSNGLLEINANGSFTYTPNNNFVGREIFSYTASDGVLSDTAIATITVKPIGRPAPPAANNLVGYFESDFGVTEDAGAVSGWLSGAGTNLDLTASGNPQLVLNATPTGAAAIRLDGNGDWLDRNLTLDTGGTDLPTGAAPRTMYFVVNYKTVDTYAGVSYGSAANNQAFGLVINGGGGNLGVQGYASGDLISSSNGIGNDDGSTGDDWFIQSVRYDGSSVRLYRDGTLLSSANRSFATGSNRFVIGQEIGGFGNGEAFDVAAVLIYNTDLSDSEHAQTLQYLSDKYLVTPSNNTPPLANNDSATTDEDTPILINVLANDSDSDGSIAAVVRINGLNATVGSPITLTSGATATLLADRTIRYNPNRAFESLNDSDSGSDSFTYTIADDGGALASATVSLTINGLTDPPPVPGTGRLNDGLVAAFESDAGLSTSGSTVTAWADGSGFDSTSPPAAIPSSSTPPLPQAPPPSASTATAMARQGPRPGHTPTHRGRPTHHVLRRQLQNRRHLCRRLLRLRRQQPGLRTRHQRRWRQPRCSGIRLRRPHLLLQRHRQRRRQHRR